MGDFWDDIKKKNEERRIAGIKAIFVYWKNR